MPDAAAGFRSAYQSRLVSEWEEDPAQAAAVERLARLLADLASPAVRPVKGLYLHGPVGRGKSQLLDLFVAHSGAVPVRRTHMHRFMAEIHQCLFDIRAGDPVSQTAREMAGEFRVLGFDEFYVTNIADSMLLGRLFEHLFKLGMVVVATSNWPMEDLYQDGRNRKSFLPFLRILQRNLQAIDLGDGRDYRRADDARWPLYVLTSDACGEAPELTTLLLRYGGNDSSTASDAGPAAKARQGSCAWYRFADLCEQPLGRAEYMALLCGLDTLLIEGLPRFGAAQSDAVLRFVTLVDICYELRRRVIVSAPDYPEALYVDGPVYTAYQRAASRLTEMQGWA